MQKSLPEKLTGIWTEISSENTPRGANIAAAIRLALSVLGSVLIVKVMGAI